MTSSRDNAPLVLFDTKKNEFIKEIDIGVGASVIYSVACGDNKYIYGVARIGYDIGYSKPKCEIDRFSKIHILTQSSPRIYTYYVYDTDCHLDLKEVYKKDKTVPCLVRDSDTGKIFVAGGTKAREGTDYFEENP